jgi:hypothetical protein
MGELIHHRWFQRLRKAVCGIFVLQELLAPWAVAPVYAKNPDSIQIGVIPVSPAPPTKINCEKIAKV